MSAKPNISLARWADLVGSFVTDATSGLRDTGFVDATPAEADIVNAELKQLYLWALWLSDGDCAFHNLSASGTLGVTGATTLGAVTASGLVTASAGLTVPTGQAVTLAGTATLTTGTGAVAIGGALGVTGTTTLAGAATGNLSVHGSLNLDSRVRYVNGQPRVYSSATAVPFNAAVSPHPYVQGAGIDVGITNTEVICPFDAEPGRTITAIAFYVFKGSSGATTMQVTLHDDTIGPPLTNFQAFVGSTSANNPGVTTITASGLSLLLQSGHVYTLAINNTGTTAGAGVDFCYGWRVVTD